MKKGEWYMHADGFGVYSLLLVDAVDEEATTVQYTIYNREHNFAPAYWGATIAVILNFNPTLVPHDTAVDLLQLLQRKLP